MKAWTASFRNRTSAGERPVYPGYGYAHSRAVRWLLPGRTGVIAEGLLIEVRVGA
ncbi:CRISPR-associated protein Cas5 [Streptomyces kunmingensis]|uniref:CRISPR-associated protein Cas5 n=1 Tax=Streptomyces kunmingensis TaxID=68225 RepID=UPI003983B2CC